MMRYAVSADRQVGRGIEPAARQRTLKSSITCRGVGLHSGSKVTMTLHPAPADAGVVFRRTDVAGGLIPARWDSVTDTRLNTCIANADGVAVGTIEHLMAAIAGAALDNVLIEISGPEVPVMDGSAAPFLFLIECAGLDEQEAPRRALKLMRRVAVRDGDKVAMLSPAPLFSVRCEIDFPGTLIGRQDFAVDIEGDNFKTEIGRARTFGFEHEVAQLHAAGLARGGSLANAVVFSGDRVLNEDGLRYGDECVRHKVLDAVGDLYLAGGPLLAHFHGIRSGHGLNNLLLRELFADRSAWAWVPMPGEMPALSLPTRMVANG